MSSVDSSFDEPGSLEVFLTKLMHGTVGKGRYRDFVRRLGLRGDERVIDYGSGTGVMSQLVAERLENGKGHLTCVDISEVWMDVARKRLKGFANVDFKRGDICALDIEDVGYDVAIVSFVLHDMDEEERLPKIKCLVRKLKADGRLFITEPVSHRHGIAVDRIHALTAETGMVEIASRYSTVPIMGLTYHGAFVMGATRPAMTGAGKQVSN